VDERPGARAVTEQILAECVQRARRLIGGEQRRLLGITGGPGAGKSTLASWLAEALGADAVVVPLDGFHLAQAELRRLGREDRKGAPDTFDAAGYVALLRRLRHPDARTVYAPQFRREIEEPIAGAIPVGAGVPLVITEGNYLLVREGPWAQIRSLLDEVWFLDIDEDLRLTRLTDRHVRFGRDRVTARRRALGSDQRNAELIAETWRWADFVIS
jgi:pantothenate kinase